MNMKIIKLTMLSLLLSLNLLGQNLPKVVNYNDQLLEYNGYTLSYNESHEQANWVFYVLKPEDLLCDKKVKRKNKFKEDFSFPTHSATLPDYKGSGYDRGHLKPAGDEPCDREQMDETFYLTNISPQEPSFNRGIWKKLETHVRNLAEDNDSLHIVTGPVLTHDMNKLGISGLSIPFRFYKVVYIFKNGEMSVLCYLLPNVKSKEDLNTYLVTLEHLESITKIDFP